MYPIRIPFGKPIQFTLRVNATWASDQASTGGVLPQRLDLHAYCLGKAAMTEDQDWKSPLDYLYEREQNERETVYLCQPKDGEYYQLTWGQVADQARRIATALRDIGIKPGEHVGILSKNCAEWIVADLAIMMAGCVSIPIYGTANASTIGFILEHSGCKAIFVGKLDHWQQQAEGVPAETH